jgi:hypothetical protein
MNNELQQLKEDIELLKLSIAGKAGVSVTLKLFEEGRYSAEDRKYFNDDWKKLRQKAIKLGLI